MKNINSELESNKNFNIKNNLSVIDKYINKLTRRLKDKQIYINFLLSVLQKNFIKINKEDFKSFKKNKVDFYIIEKEELSNPSYFGRKENPKQEDQKIIPSYYEPMVKKLNVIPQQKGTVCNLVLPEIDSGMAYQKNIKAIMEEPKGLGLVQEFSMGDFKEIEKWDQSLMSSGKMEKQLEEEPKEENNEVEEIKNLINKADFKKLNREYLPLLEDYDKNDIKNILNYLKRKMKKIKLGVIEKIDYISFKSFLEQLYDNQ